MTEHGYATAADYTGAAPMPVPVHVASIGAGIGPIAPAGPPGYRGVYHTVTLTAGEGAQQLMPASRTREIAWVTAIDADIWLGDNLSDVAAGRGAYVPCVTPSTGKPSLGGPFPVEDYGPVFAGVVTALAGANIVRVSVVAYHRPS
jgi:hypothetical protein